MLRACLLDPTLEMPFYPALESTPRVLSQRSELQNQFYPYCIPHEFLDGRKLFDDA